MLSDKDRQQARNICADIIHIMGDRNEAELFKTGNRDKTVVMKQAMQLIASCSDHLG